MCDIYASEHRRGSVCRAFFPSPAENVGSNRVILPPVNLGCRIVLLEQPWVSLASGREGFIGRNLESNKQRSYASMTQVTQRTQQQRTLSYLMLGSQDGPLLAPVEANSPESPDAPEEENGKGERNTRISCR